MSRKTTAHEATKTAPSVPTATRSRRKSRAPRVRLTHFEIRRGETLRLRIAVADDALAEVGDELGALIKRIAPSTQAMVVAPAAPVIEHPEVVISREHFEHDAVYHAELREHLEALLSSLCDEALDDALDVARKERDRRAEGGN